MSIELTAKPAQNLEVPVEVSNTSTDRAAGVDIAIGYLVQPNVGWNAVEPASATPEVLKTHSSCLPWTKLDKSTLDIPALGKQNVTLKLAVPASARGFYCAALTIITRPSKEGTGVKVLLRFVIPVLVQIEGSIPSRKIELGKPQVEYTPPNAQSGPMVQMGLLVKNSGEALSRIGGKIGLFTQVGQRWLPVTLSDIQPRRVIPGANTLVSITVPKKIPSGRYRVEADLKADSQRLPHYVQELDVVGDPSARQASPDAAIIIEPAQLELEVQPGAVRSGTITYRNPTDETLTMKLSVSGPKSLENISMGTLKGEDIIGSKWSTISPDTITLGPGEVRRVRVAAEVPEGADKPYYYVNIIGQIMRGDEPAGQTRSLVAIRNKPVAPTVALQENSKVIISGGPEEGYTAMMSYANVGLMHLSPTVTFSLADTSKQNRFETFPAEAEIDQLLPLSIGRYSAKIMLTGLKPGDYALIANCTYGEKSIETVAPVRVTSAKSGKLTLQLITSKAPAKPPTKKTKGSGK
jgi:hypothetical protein